VWRLALEERGLRIHRSKIEYIENKFEEKEHVDETRSEMAIDGNRLKEVECFKY